MQGGEGSGVGAGKREHNATKLGIHGGHEALVIGRCDADEDRLGWRLQGRHDVGVGV
jgi:hypothetical protein